MRVIVLALWMAVVVVAQNYLVSLTFPFLIDNNRTNIKYIGSDFSGNFLVSLENAQGRRYDPTFTSYVNFTMPEAATLLTGVSKTINGFISLNGSGLTSKGQMVTSLSNQKSTVRDYDYESLILLESYSVIDSVNFNYLLPLNISGHVQALHILYCQNNLKIGFDGAITQISGFYASGSQNYDVEFISESLSVTSNVLTVTVDVYLAQSGNAVYEASIIIQLQYDPATNMFAFLGTQNLTMTLLMTTPFQGTSLSMANGLLLIQNQASGNTAMYNTLTSTVGTVSGFSSNEILLFFFIFSKYYALLTNGLSLINFNSGSNTLTFFSLTIPLLNNIYGLSPGNANVDPFYIVDQPYVYKSGKCTGQTLIGIGGLCISYSCLTPYCSSCPFTPLTCGVCEDGYYKSGLLFCVKQSSTTGTNTTSSTSSSNSTVDTTTNSTSSSTSTTNSSSS